MKEVPVVSPALRISIPLSTAWLARKALTGDDGDGGEVLGVALAKGDGHGASVASGPLDDRGHADLGIGGSLRELKLLSRDDGGESARGNGEDLCEHGVRFEIKD